ncbi:MAG: GNAT family N-acetyltransferase, partial [Planctomycetes bacterium]|nr:GNAT family N-acetyltransferase [Planctomycetota bacterium]
WCVDYQGTSYGRVHWVAIIPKMQGHGLSKPLTSTICHRMQALGHAQAYLTTSTTRYGAINLYHQFGFVPVISTTEEQEVWDELFPKLHSQFRI